MYPAMPGASRTSPPPRSRRAPTARPTSPRARITRPTASRAPTPPRAPPHHALPPHHAPHPTTRPTAPRAPPHRAPHRTARPTAPRAMATHPRNVLCSPLRLPCPLCLLDLLHVLGRDVLRAGRAVCAIGVIVGSWGRLFGVSTMIVGSWGHPATRSALNDVGARLCSSGSCQRVTCCWPRRPRPGDAFDHLASRSGSAAPAWHPPLPPLGIRRELATMYVRR